MGSPSSRFGLTKVLFKGGGGYECADNEYLVWVNNALYLYRIVPSPCGGSNARKIVQEWDKAKILWCGH